MLNSAISHSWDASNISGRSKALLKRLLPSAVPTFGLLVSAELKGDSD